MPQRIVFPEPGKVELRSFELPRPGPQDLQLRTLHSLVSIGTECTLLHQRYERPSHFSKMFSFPQLKTGVQAVARIEAIGAEVRGFSIGQPVYIRQAHCSHATLPSKDCSPIPAGADLRQASWAGLAKTAYRAAWAGRFGPGQNVLIIGAGPVGQMAVRWAHVMKAESITLVDPCQSRLDMAALGGRVRGLCGEAAQCQEALAEIADGQGASGVVDSTGHPEVLGDALNAAGRYGKVILLGDTGYPSQQHLNSAMMSKGLTLQAVHESHDIDGWTQERIDSLFFDHLVSGQFQLQGLITHEFMPEDFERVYETACGDPRDVMGLLIGWS